MTEEEIKYYNSQLELQFSEHLSKMDTVPRQYYIDIVHQFTKNNKPLPRKVTQFIIKKDRKHLAPKTQHWLKDPLFHLIWAQLLLKSRGITGQIQITQALNLSRKIYNPIIHSILLRIFITTSSIKLKRALISVLLKNCEVSAYSGIVYFIISELNPSSHNYGNNSYWLLQKDIIQLIAQLKPKERVTKILKSMLDKNLSPQIKVRNSKSLRQRQGFLPIHFCSLRCLAISYSSHPVHSQTSIMR